MSRRRSAARPFALIAAFLCLSLAPAFAQTADSPLDYPTIAALEAAVIPARSRVELAERLRSVDPASIPPTPAAAPARQVGEQQVFTAINSSDDTLLTIPATLRVVGEHIYLWVEDGADVRDVDLQNLAHDFDTGVYPNVRALWGSEATPGVDGDPRIYGLFASNLGAAVAAYFASDHTYPREVVPVSNQHEMFFFNLDAIGADFPRLAVASIVAHEFQHMIRFNLQFNPETWLNEGLSTFTQFYLYDDLDSTILSFLRHPNTQLNDWQVEPEARAVNYGAATMFMLYLYERYGIEALQALGAERDLRGLQAVDDVLAARGEPGVNVLFADWVLANALFDDTYKRGRFGYRDLPELPVPPAVATVAQYPFSGAGSGSQYAASYYTLANLNGRTSLDIELAAPASVSLIPMNASSGDHFWYSNRADMSDARLTRAFDLSGVAAATLEYRLWHDVEASWDYGYVMISEDDGATWAVLATPHTTTDDPQHVAYGAGYTGASDGWLSEAVALDAYAGKRILVRFEMITDDAVTRPGMALDDVRIAEIGYADDFEGGEGDWQAEGWLWTDNRLPQGGWVQLAQKAGTETLNVQRWPLDNAWHTIRLARGVDSAVLAISPFAPVTTVAMPYTLTVAAN